MASSSNTNGIDRAGDRGIDWRRGLLVCAGYAAVGLLLMARAIPHWGTRAIGATGVGLDMPLHLWQYWWVHFALRKSLPLLYCTYAMYPAGSDLVLHWGGHLDLLLGMPLMLLTSPVGVHNTLTLVAIAGNGLCGYLVFRRLVRDRWFAFWGGCMFALIPHLLLEIAGGRFEQALAGPMVLCISFLIDSFEKPGIRAPALATLCFAVTTFSYLGYGVFLLILVALYAAYYVAVHRRKALNRALGVRVVVLAAGIGLAGLAIASPNLVRDESYRRSFPQVWQDGMFSGRGRAAAQLTELRSWSALSLKRYFELFPERDLGRARCNWVLVVLALLGLWRRPKGVAPWLLFGGAFFVFALGPTLRIGWGEQPVAVPSPVFLALSYVCPPIRRFYFLDRFMILVDVALVILAICGLRHWCEKAPRCKLRYWAPAVAAFAVYAESAARGLIGCPLPTWPAFHPSQACGYLAEQTDDCAVIELTFPPVMSGKGRAPHCELNICRVGRGAAYGIYTQMAHGKRTLACGSVDFLVQPYQWAFVERNSVLRFFESADKHSVSSIAPLDVEILQLLGFRYVLARAVGPGLPAAVARLRALFGTPKLVDDASGEALFEIAGLVKRGRGRTGRPVPEVQEQLAALLSANGDPGEFSPSEMNRPEAAIDVLVPLLREQPSNARAYVYLGRTLEAKGLPFLAEQAYARALEINGSLASATSRRDHIRSLPGWHAFQRDEAFRKRVTLDRFLETVCAEEG